MALFGRELSSMIRNHWGLDGGNGVIFGGIHQKKGGAEAAKQVRVKAAERASYGLGGFGGDEAARKKEKEVSRWRNMPIMWLKEGDEYTPFGHGKKVIHGKTDGAHHSSATNHVRFVLEKRSR